MGKALRSMISALLAIAACALTVVAIAATWMNWHVMDSGRWTETSLQVLRDPGVQEITAAFLADQLVAQQATAASLPDALPPGLRGFSGTATAALGELAERTALQTLRARALEDLWATASRRTHAQFVRWVDGQPVPRGGDAVTLDLQPAIKRLARRVGISEAVIVAASKASGGAEVPLVGAGEFEQTRRDAHRLERTSALTLPLALLVAALSIVIAHRRRTALVQLGLGAVGAGLMVIAGAPELGSHLVAGLVDGGAARPVAEAILDATTPDLTRAGWLTAVGGALIAILAFAGRPGRGSARTPG